MEFALPFQEWKANGALPAATESSMTPNIMNLLHMIPVEYGAVKNILEPWPNYSL